MFAPRVAVRCPRHAQVRTLVSKSHSAKPKPAKAAKTKTTPNAPKTKIHLPPPRLDYARLLSNPEATVRNVRDRAMPLSADVVSELGRLRARSVSLETQLNRTRHEQGLASAALRDTKDASSKALALERAKSLKETVQGLEREHREVEEALLRVGGSLPNFSHPAVPLGAEENAITLETFGPACIPATEERDHVHIAEKFGWLDNTASAIATGNSWPFLLGALAQLEHALVAYAVDQASRAGFTPVSPPDVVGLDIAARCGFQPRDGPGEDAPRQTYIIESDEGERQLCLTGTAEVPLAALWANRTLKAESLPMRVVGVGKAFRAEAGARGADTRGLYRVHQFTKVELFAVTSQEGSEGVMEELRGLQRRIIEGLGLSVRVLDMPTQELGASASRKYDMEAWMPGRGKWGEITSTSNCTDYQARRLHIRYNDTDGTGTKFAHTLNGTAAAIPRLIVALLENGARIENGQVVAVQLPRTLERYWVGNTPENIEWK